MDSYGVMWVYVMGEERVHTQREKGRGGNGEGSAYVERHREIHKHKCTI